MRYLNKIKKIVSKFPFYPFSEIAKHDEERREAVKKMLTDGKLKTGDDYYNAAFIFQHGESVDEARTAYSLAWIAASLMPDNKKAQWLATASWDRMMMRQKKPQWYGTQYVPSENGKEWLLYNFDADAVTDQERQSFGIQKAKDIDPSFPRAQRPDQMK